MASWLPLCVSMHMLVSYNLCSNLGTGYCYENLAGTGGVKGCVCVSVCVWSVWTIESLLSEGRMLP